MAMRVMAGRAILLFGLSEMLSKPQAGLTAARLLKENTALGDRAQLQHSLACPCTPGWTLGSPFLFPEQGEAAEQDKPCPWVSGVARAHKTAAARGSPAQLPAPGCCHSSCLQGPGTAVSAGAGRRGTSQVSALARDTHQTMAKPFAFPFPFQRGPETGILLKLQDTQAGLRSWDGGMLQTLLLALSAPLLPGALTVPQSSCREAKLEEGGTSTEAVQVLAKELQAQARNMEMLLSAGSREAGTRKKVTLRRASSTQLQYQQSLRAQHLCLWPAVPAHQGHRGV